MPQAASATSGAEKLKDQRILNAPITIDLPGLNGIEVSGNRSRRSKEFRLDSPEFRQFDGGGLCLAAFIRTPGLEHGFFSIPIPGEPKARVRLRIHRPLDFSFLPSISTVNGNLDLADYPSAGPRQAADLIEPRAGQYLAAGRARNHRSRSHFELEPPRQAVHSKAGILGAFPHAHIRLIHHLDSAQPLHIVDAFPAGDEQTHRIALLRTESLAILTVGHQNVVHGLLNRNALRVLALF